MKLERTDGGVRASVSAYREGAVTVDGKVLIRSFLLSTDGLLQDWRPTAAAELAASDFEELAALHPQVVIVGTGRRREQPPAHCLEPLIRAKIGFETMDTGAACRTYGVLAAEGRRVVLAVLMPRG